MAATVMLGLGGIARWVNRPPSVPHLVERAPAPAPVPTPSDTAPPVAELPQPPAVTRTFAIALSPIGVRSGAESQV